MDFSKFVLNDSVYDLVCALAHGYSTPLDKMHHMLPLCNKQLIVFGRDRFL